MKKRALSIILAVLMTISPSVTCFAQPLTSQGETTAAATAAAGIAITAEKTTATAEKTADTAAEPIEGYVEPLGASMSAITLKLTEKIPENGTSHLKFYDVNKNEVSEVILEYDSEAGRKQTNSVSVYVKPDQG